MKISLLLAALLAVLPSGAHAADGPAPAPPATEAPKPEPHVFADGSSEEPPLTVFSAITKIPGDYAAAASTIFAKDQLVPWTAVVVSTAGLMKYDYETWQPFHDWHYKNKGFHDVTEFGWNVGKGGFQFGIAGGFLAYGALFGQHRALRTASQIIEVVLVAGITTQVLKHIAGRESPNVATDVQTGRWHWFPNPVKYSKRVSAYDAFPSGHIATTFGTARVIELNYPEYKWIPFVTYPIVGFVMVSMVATNGHWWSDYPLSLFLAYHFANAVTRGNHPQKAESPTAWHIDPYSPLPGATGIAIGRAF
jgi:membrane-associated phospholipid phosphatase